MIENAKIIFEKRINIKNETMYLSLIKYFWCHALIYQHLLCDIDNCKILPLSMFGSKHE